MAVRTAWWMPQQASSLRRRHQPPSSAAVREPWEDWPASLPSSGLGFHHLDTYLDSHLDDECDVVKYTGNEGTAGKDPLWTRVRDLRSPDELFAALHEPHPPETMAVFYLVMKRSAKVVRILGHGLDLTPRFFNITPATFSSGSVAERFVFFTIQFMEQYPAGQVPEEAAADPNLPSRQFRTEAGLTKHTWHVTRLSVIFVKRPQSPSYASVCILSPSDTGFKEGLHRLMTKVEDRFPGNKEAVGIAELLTEIIYVISFTWGVMVDEAERHVRVLTKLCMAPDLESGEQIAFTRELHELTPLWVQMRRRLQAFRVIIVQMTNHPFFVEAGVNKAIDSYLGKTVGSVDDHLERIKELGDETNVLISLLFNISTLQDTRVAIEESHLANRIASSIRRLSVITFFYLPIAISAGALGMNVQEISKDPHHPPVWLFFALCVGLLVVSTVPLVVWSRYLASIKTAQIRRAKIV